MLQKLSDSELREMGFFCKQVRLDVVEMIYSAKSGHPGGNLSAVEILSVLYKKCLNHFPDWDKNPKFNTRDRFILSKGHASAALYSILAHCGYFPSNELLSFRKFPTRLQGHPSCRHVNGIEVSTGSLGQGLSLGCGVALGLKLDKNPANVVVYLGDGELQEGNVWEGVMNAAHFGLDNIIAFVDKNNLQIDGCTQKIKNIDNLGEKFKAFNWDVIEIDGHNLHEIYGAYQEAKAKSGEWRVESGKFLENEELGIRNEELISAPLSTLHSPLCSNSPLSTLHSPLKKKPTVIIANTVKGKGVSFMENNVGWHGKAPNTEEFEKAVKELRGAPC